MPGVVSTVNVKYTGLDTKEDKIELISFAESLGGIAKIIAMSYNLIHTGKVNNNISTHAIKVFAHPVEKGCVNLNTTVEALNQLQLFSGCFGTIGAVVIQHIFSSLPKGRNERGLEAIHLKSLLEKAVDKIGERDHTIINRILDQQEKLFEAIIPAARNAVTPIGTTCSLVSLTTNGRTSSWDANAKAIILDEELPDILTEKTYLITVTELNIESGSCHFHFMDGKERIKTKGKITDPVLHMANNKYALALATQEKLLVKGKAAIKNGKFESIYISDTV